MNRSRVVQYVKKLARETGWTIRRTSRSEGSSYVYLERTITLVVRVSDHSTSQEVFSIESERGEFEHSWRERRGVLWDLLTSPLMAIRGRKRKKRFPKRRKPY